jgi:6-phosphofructokinase
MATKRIGILTGGGDCPGLNAVIRAVAKTAINDHGWDGGGVSRTGISGAHRKPHAPELDLKSATSNILTLGGTILGTSNKANPGQVQGRRGRRRATAIIRNVTDQAASRTPTLARARRHRVHRR